MRPAAKGVALEASVESPPIETSVKGGRRKSTAVVAEGREGLLLLRLLPRGRLWLLGGDPWVCLRMTRDIRRGTRTLRPLRTEGRPKGLRLLWVATLARALRLV